MSARPARYPIRALLASVMVWVLADVSLAGPESLVPRNPDRVTQVVAFTHYSERLTRGVGHPVLVAFAARPGIPRVAKGADGAIGGMSSSLKNSGAAHRARAPPR